MLKPRTQALPPTFSDGALHYMENLGHSGVANEKKRVREEIRQRGGGAVAFFGGNMYDGPAASALGRGFSALRDVMACQTVAFASMALQEFGGQRMHAAVEAATLTAEQRHAVERVHEDLKAVATMGQERLEAVRRCAAALRSACAVWA